MYSVRSFFSRSIIPGGEARIDCLRVKYFTCGEFERIISPEEVVKRKEESKNDWIVAIPLVIVVFFMILILK